MEWGVPGGNVFCVASVYDKVTRACIFNSAAEGQQVPTSTKVEMCKARLCPAAVPTRSEETPEIATFA